LTAAANARTASLESILAEGLSHRPDVSFSALKQVAEVPPFDARGLDEPLAAPEWVDFAPTPPSMLGRIFSGGAKYERQERVAHEAFEQRRAEHATAETKCQRQLEEGRRLHDAQVAAATEAAEQHNLGVDDFQREFLAGEPQAVMRFFTLVLDSSQYPEGFPHQTRVIYRPHPKDLIVEYELPPQDIVPVEKEYRYVQKHDEIDVIRRSAKDISGCYASVIAQVALRTLHEIFAADANAHVSAVTFNGRVSTIDKATGRQIRPHLISVTAAREQFSTLVLANLDPVACLKHLNALVSRHPYDLEAVQPVVDFEALLVQYKFVGGIDAIATLDSRRDLLKMTPIEFEHFTRQLFEAMGMKSWVTQASKDDGVDGVATNEDPIFGGLCIIQAKRYSGAVGVDAIRALAGVMEDKHATKGILVTTSWVTLDGRAFAARHGRIQVIECEELKYLCQRHLGLDVLISLPKSPPSHHKTSERATS
jgi:restriction system protein